jgi:hypothetical protein
MPGGLNITNTRISHREVKRPFVLLSARINQIVKPYKMSRLFKGSNNIVAKSIKRDKSSTTLSFTL